jgi:hypothetical protein
VRRDGCLIEALGQIMPQAVERLALKALVRRGIALRSF